MRSGRLWLRSRRDGAAWLCSCRRQHQSGIGSVFGASVGLRKNCDLMRGRCLSAANQLQLDVFESCVGMPCFFTAEHLPAGSPLEVGAPFVRHHDRARQQVLAMFGRHIAQDGLGAHAESGIAKRLITSDGDSQWHQGGDRIECSGLRMTSFGVPDSGLGTIRSLRFLSRLFGCSRFSRSMI